MAGIRNFSATFLKVAAKLQQNSIDLSNPRISVKFRGKSTQTRRNLNDFSDISAELLNVPKKRTISEFWKWHWNNGVELEKAAYWVAKFRFDTAENELPEVENPTIFMNRWWTKFAHRHRFEQTRHAELLDVQRMEAAEKRREDEKMRRFAQEKARAEEEYAAFKKAHSYGCSNS